MTSLPFLVRSDFQRENGDSYDRPDIQMHSFPFITSVDYGRGWEVTHNIKPERSEKSNTTLQSMMNARVSKKMFCLRTYIEESGVTFHTNF